MAKKFYLGERHNPQLKKPYYVAYGQLTKKGAKAAENCVYGNMYLTPYDDQESYDTAVQAKKDDGYTVNVRSETYAKIVRK